MIWMIVGGVLLALILCLPEVLIAFFPKREKRMESSWKTREERSQKLRKANEGELEESPWRRDPKV